jgi:hypothetical protein
MARLAVADRSGGSALGQCLLKHPATSLRSVEGDHAGRVFVLALKKVEDDGFQIGGLDVGFPIDPAIPAEVVDHEIDVLIVAFGHDRRSP